MDVSSLSLDKEDLRRFCDILQERSNSAAEIEVGLFQKNEQTDDQFEENKKTLRESFQLKLTISGKGVRSCGGQLKMFLNQLIFPNK